jgi:hypothetical protein
MTVQTVSDRERLYTKNEVQQADQALDLMRKLGHPSPHQMSQMLKYGVLGGARVTTRDVVRAWDIRGQTAEYAAGKTTKRRLSLPTRDQIDQLVEIRQEIYMDIFFFDNVAFLIGVSKPMGLATCTPLGRGEGRRSEKIIANSIRRHLSTYKSHGFQVSKLYSDHEAGIIAAAQRVNEVPLVALGAGQKDGIVDARIKFVKTTARAIKSGLSYSLSTILVVYLVSYAVVCTNIQLHRTGYDTISPREMLSGIKLDVKRDLRVGFGEFCYVFGKSDNTSAPRTTAAIALIPAGGYTGAHKFLNLSTGRVITRAQFTSVPIPAEYVVVLNLWAKKDAATVSVGHDAESLAHMLGNEDVETDGWLERFHRNLVSNAAQGESQTESVINAPEPVVTDEVPAGIIEQGAVTLSPPSEEISMVTCEVYNLTLQQATEAYGNRAGEAAIAEIQQLHE